MCSAPAVSLYKLYAGSYSRPVVILLICSSPHHMIPHTISEQLLWFTYCGQEKDRDIQENNNSHDMSIIPISSVFNIFTTEQATTLSLFQSIKSLHHTSQYISLSVSVILCHFFCLSSLFFFFNFL